MLSTWRLYNFYLFHITGGVRLQHLKHFFLPHALLLAVDVEDDATGAEQRDVVIGQQHPRGVTQQVGGIDGTCDVARIEDNSSRRRMGVCPLTTTPRIACVSGCIRIVPTSGWLQSR